MWTVDYFNHYKAVTVLNPWREAEATFQYVLVQCGTPTLDGYDAAQIVEVPASSIVAMSTTYLPHLDTLNLLPALVGLDDSRYVSTPAVREMIDAGRLTEIGSGGSVNVEMALDLDPDVVMTYGTGNLDFDAHPKLLEAGLSVVINAEYMETSPLGRTEWLKFTSLFFNREAAAEAAFADIAARYTALAAQTQPITDRPTVFTGSDFGGTWYMPGGQSFVARFLADAGADYLWADDTSTGSMPLDFEVVFEQASTADIWLNPGQWQSLAEGEAADARYALFEAFQNGAVYNNNVRLNEYGGNDYWESGVANPDVVLADLIAILHPDLLPDHELVYHQRLE